MALRLPSLRHGSPQVVAGRRNLGRRIRWVHSAEVPNIATLLKGEELLLTTGMGMGSKPLEQRRFVRALAERGVAGLVIELGQVFSQLPEPLVEEAAACELPLIELRREVPFVDVTEEIHAAILHRQLAVLRRGDELHRRLTELMLEGAGIPDILAALAETIANPVLLEKAGQGVLYHATYRAPPADVFAAWDFRREELEGETTGNPHAVVCPVHAARDRTWGRLLALAVDSPLDDFHRVAVERAVALVALALLRTRQETLLASRERGNFLAEVAAGRVDPLDAAARAETLGFPSRHGRLLALAVAPRELPDNHFDVDEADWTPLWRAVVDRLNTHGLAALVGACGEGEALVLLSLPAPRSRDEAATLSSEVVEEALRRHLGRSDLAVLAVGAVVERWDDVGPALRQAAETASLARAAPHRAWHDVLAPDVERLLWGMRDDERVRRFVERRLRPVLDHDQRRMAKLMPTLEALCDTGWKKAETARLLHMNRQSLYPHVHRIERLLQADLDDPQTRLGLELAVQAWRQWEKAPG